MQTKILVAAGLLSAVECMAQTTAPAPPSAPKPPVLFDSPPRPVVRAMRAIPARGTYLGVGVADVDAGRTGALKLKETRGAEVTMVSPDSPAAKAGIRVGDVILDYNGQPVEGTAELQRLVHETPAGHQAKIGLWRNGAPTAVTVTIEENEHALALHNDYWPFGPGFPNMPPMPAIDIPRIVTTYENSALGVDCQVLTPNSQFAEFFGVKDGLLVLSVSRNSAAEKAGVKAGDVIVKAGDAHIANHRDLSAALRDNRGKAVPLTVMRNKHETVLTATLDDNGQPRHGFVGRARGARTFACRVETRLDAWPVWVRISSRTPPYQMA